MKRLAWVILSGVLLLTSFVLAAEDDSVSMQQLMSCRELADIDQRVACYDRIAQSGAAAEAPAAEPPAAANSAAAAAAPAAVAAPSPEKTTPAAPPPAKDVATDTADEPANDFGLPKAEDEFTSLNVKVSRCGKSNNRKFYFYLEDGQVWQYLGMRDLRYRACELPAVLREDSFGYTLQLEGKSSVRVKRVR